MFSGASSSSSSTLRDQEYETARGSVETTSVWFPALKLGLGIFPQSLSFISYFHPDFIYDWIHIKVRFGIFGFPTVLQTLNSFLSQLCGPRQLPVLLRLPCIFAVLSEVLLNALLFPREMMIPCGVYVWVCNCWYGKREDLWNWENCDGCFSPFSLSSEINQLIYWWMQARNFINAKFSSCRL